VQSPKDKRVLISTIAPVSGGVPAMTEFVVRELLERGYEPVIAHYEPYSVTPSLSVPSFRLFQRRVSEEIRESYGDRETHAIGAWLPELEFTHYLPTKPWRELMASCRFHMAVSGNALAATPFLRSGRTYLAWIATGWQDDRKDRVSHFPWLRKLLDRIAVRPVLRRLEPAILRGGDVLALSRYTRRVMHGIAGPDTDISVLPMPVDVTMFGVDDAAVVPGRIGFSGRVDDPRKNVELLLRAMAELTRRDIDVSAVLIGGDPVARTAALLDELNIRNRVTFVPYLSKEALARQLKTIDVFVVPSHQEGLCISALEAMASGCPVVSTKCGGPEEYVIDDETGYLTGFDARSLADAVERVVTDRTKRARLSKAALATVHNRYNREAASRAFWARFGETFAIEDPMAESNREQSESGENEVRLPAGSAERYRVSGY